MEESKKKLKEAIYFLCQAEEYDKTKDKGSGEVNRY